MERFLLILFLVGCGASNPNPEALENRETAKSELAKFGVVVSDGVRETDALRALISQMDAYSSNASKEIDCTSSSEGSAPKYCACRIVPSCSKCDGGPVRCFLNEEHRSQYAAEFQRRECVERGSQFAVYQVHESRAFAWGNCED